MLTHMGLGVLFQIFIKVVIYLELYSLVQGPPFKHEHQPAHVKLFASVKESLMVFQARPRFRWTETYQYLLPCVRELVSVAVIVSQSSLLVSREI